MLIKEEKKENPCVTQLTDPKDQTVVQQPTVATLCNIPQLSVSVILTTTLSTKRDHPSNSRMFPKVKTEMKMMKDKKLTLS